MDIKSKITSFFLSKINVGAFSNLIKKSTVLSLPYKIFSQTLIDKNFPQHIFLETTNACNLKCAMCPRQLSPVKIGSMDFGLFKKAVDEAEKYGPRNFSLHLFGEPLMDSQLSEKIKYIKEKNNKNSILLTTNGTLLRKPQTEEIIRNGVDKVFVSLHAADEKIYQKITGVDFLKQVEQNVIGFIELKKRLGAEKPKIILRMIVSKDNASNKDAFREKWKKYPVILEIRLAHNYGGKITDNPLRPAEKKRYPCYHLWLSPAVHWNGEMSICCNDSMRETALGNIKEKTISEMWKSEVMRNYRHFHLTGRYDKIPLCKNCDVWSLYPDIFFSWQKK